MKRITNPIEKDSTYKQEWYKKNKERLLLKAKTYRETHRIKIRNRDKEYKLKNKQILQLKSVEYIKTHKEQIKKYLKEYRKRPEALLKERVRNKKRRSTIEGKLNNSLSSVMGRTLKGYKNNKAWLSLVDYTLDELKEHLQNQFTEGMHWNNHGMWHIDHIKPICSFKFNSYNDPEFKECWSLQNLRPLWAKDNLKKSSEDKKISVNKLYAK